ncbi:MAG: DNA primase [Burkholderiaceae bacterium]|jgi:DNA primase|nr:DNA primase [Burkholderiaceae bacterium]
MIPQSFIQDLLARADIADVVGRYVQLKKAGQNLLGLCPFHGEKTPSFTVSPSKQFFHCFGCGAHGSAIGFLMEHRGLGYVEAIRDLAQMVGMQVPEEPSGAAEAHSKTRALTEMLAQAADFYRKQLKVSEAAVQYLKARGLTGQTAARFGLGYSPDAWQPLRGAFEDYDDPRLGEAGLVISDEGKRYDRFRGRIMFPIRNPRGQVIGFGARTLGAGEPKYLNSPETPVFRKGQELYGLHEARDAIRQSGRAIVVEGYMDVIQLSQAGFGEAVAALGTAITGAHVSALLRVTDHVVFAFDGDAAGRKAARRALEATLPVIADTKRASFLLLPEGEDPDSLIKAQGSHAFETELAHALPLSQFFIRALSGGPLATAEDRAALVAAAKPLLLSMAPGAMRSQLLRELAAAARMPAEDIEALFGLRRSRPGRPAPLARRTPHMEVDDLKRRVLQQLLVHPQLAHEFGDAVSEEHAGREEPVDREIVEVSEAARSQTPAATGALSHGALMELLTDSEHAIEYRALAAQEMELETDVETARQIVEEAFAKLRLRRLERLRAERLDAYQQDLSAEALEAYRTADQAYLRARAAASDSANR